MLEGVVSRGIVKSSLEKTHFLTIIWVILNDLRRNTSEAIMLKVYFQSRPTTVHGFYRCRPVAAMVALGGVRGYRGELYQAGNRRYQAFVPSLPQLFTGR